MKQVIRYLILSLVAILYCLEINHAPMDGAKCARL
jgi:hypothetical protein